MDEMIDKFDLVIFGVRFASKHLNMDRDYTRLEVAFASKEMFESSSYHVKYCVVMRKLLFNKDWVEETTALDVLKYSFHIVHIIFCWDLKKSTDFSETVSRHMTSLLSEDPIFLDLKDLGLENDCVILKSKEYSERMITFFHDEDRILSTKLNVNVTCVG